MSHVVSCAAQLTVAVAQLLGEHPTEEGSSYFSASQREKPGSVFPSQQPLNSKDAVLLKVQPKDFTPNLYSENSWKKSPSVSVKLRKYSLHMLLVFSQFYSQS